MNLGTVADQGRSPVHAIDIGDSAADTERRRRGGYFLVDLLRFQAKALIKKVFQALDGLLLDRVLYHRDGAGARRGAGNGLVLQHVVDGQHLHAFGVADIG